MNKRTKVEGLVRKQTKKATAKRRSLSGKPKYISKADREKLAEQAAAPEA
ncbi:DUF2986 domain-containing protein [Aliamphritea ceti]|nr:DUF2986 domain-containing protein [Aliamphritea ceti]